MLKRFRKRHRAHQHEQALSDMKNGAAMLVESIVAIIPQDHLLKQEQIDSAIEKFGRDFMADVRPYWLSEGIPPELIDLAGPLVTRIFVSEFETRFRAALPLQNIASEGSA